MIEADGTMVFDHVAVERFRLRGVESVLVFYSTPAAMFVLWPLPSGAGYGVPLFEMPNGWVMALEAADFLQGKGVLPVKHRRYEAQFYADKNEIVITNVGVCKRRTAK